MNRSGLFPIATGKFALSTVMIGLLAISAPNTSHAGDKEDALKECVKNSVSDGILAVAMYAAGCVGGYLDKKINDDDEESKASVQKFKGGAKKSFKQRRAR